MSSFANGPQSTQDTLGRPAKDWAEGTKIAKIANTERQSQKNGWQKGGSTLGNLIGTGVKGITRILGLGE